MKVIGDGNKALTVLGIVLGIIGFIGVGVNYPIYNRILQKGKEKYAGDIIRLASEIANENN